MNNANKTFQSATRKCKHAALNQFSLLTQSNQKTQFAKGSMPSSQNTARDLLNQRMMMFSQMKQNRTQMPFESSAFQKQSDLDLWEHLDKTNNTNLKLNNQDQRTSLEQDNAVHFWGKWLGGRKEEEPLPKSQKNGLSGEADESEQELQGSSSDDQGWWSGLRRPGDHHASDEEYTSEEGMGDDWEDDSDDDDHGGQMMPIPSMM